MGWEDKFGRGGPKTHPAYLRFAGFRRRSGSIPGEPYPALKQSLPVSGGRVFPVSASLGVYRMGKGKRPLELIASGIAGDLSPCG